ncbi:MAG: LysR family transcriptional regulator [Paraglaciecola sp.]|uniref:LysR family transcriptional regulator n=1 Tax=Paraglaciecola sp. TaxID=1920173 RepID=UPI00273D5A77|nr:LysR family transcriptional regulator [Paraglaciecola sp.]MDP5029892.1 LysR family transcriptional regulator [Paraglaciecola sp.]MDP5041349.1 LysR family transcriptional regulator [Paraglaciecola sp.]MDP5134006.1 LysR family transcriptional regulator [Paraglaciecola sp.]
MKLEQLVMFKAVADFGSLSQASQALHKTQPAISQGIRQLESILNVQLFSRAAYRLTLTQAGKAVYQHAQRLLDEAASLKQAANNIAAGNEISITIAIEAAFDLKGILPLLESVQSQFPNTQIVLKQEYLSGALDLLQKKLATLCISPAEGGVFHQGNFECHLLNSGVLVNVASPRLVARHPQLATRTELINEYQIVVQDSGSGTRDRDFGVQVGQRRWYVNDYATKRMLIESGMGWGKLPGNYAEQGLQNGSLVKLQLTDIQNEIKLHYQIMKNKDQTLGPVAQTLWERFRAYTFNQF